ncbi:MAG: anaerobic ribonucleoside-triphosphate reductase [Candidatus Bathyarchaeia archaeon]
MQRSLERVGASIFDAASAPVRLQILRLLSMKGQLQYTEIMFQLKLDPVRDAGKFVYHLKSLTAAGLATLDKKSKRYEITELGHMVVSFARDMDEYVNVKRGKLYVRTSRLAIEEFHRNKISRSLVIEGGVPQEIADEIAAEAEDRLVRLKTIYLTAPLIREFVNAILIEKKLEEYRHKLTRLGMPVYDVAQLIRDAGEKQLSADYVARSSARSVLSEYALLNCLPHKIADAHLSGLIHIANLENWILKPNEVIHDLRYFLANNFRGTNSPESLEGALALIGNVLGSVSGEVSGEQTLEFFNVFLSPFAKGRTLGDLSTQLTHFLTSMRRELVSGNPQQGFSIVIDTDLPEFILKEDAVGPGGEVSGHYADYTSEAFQIAEATIDAYAIASRSSYLLPHLVIRIRKRTMNDQPAKRVIEKAHELAATKSIPFFELLNDSEKSTYSATGLRLTDDWTGQWEADCIRTGSMDSIFLNLPRIAYEAKNNDDKLFILLREAANLAIDGFKEKRKFMAERLKQPLLPLLAGSNGSVAYFYDKSACYNLAFVGLSEAVEFHLNRHMEQDKTASELGLRILRELSKFADAASKASELRIRVSQRPGDEAAGRLAELDIEEYGRAVVIADGNRGPLYYSDMPTIPLSTKTSIENRISLESQLQPVMPGGHLNILCVASPSPASSLEKFTLNALFSGNKFLTYTRNYSSCNVCNETEAGIVPRCSKCGSDKLTHLGRSSYGLIPFNLWPESKRRNVEMRTSYLSTN